MDPQHYQARHSYVWKYGEELIGLLAPQPGEQILDLGCGTGQLTALLGSSVIGIDHSAEMIAEARRNFPNIRFEVADATSFTVDRPVDAVFSNAVLHWVKDPSAAAACIFRALKPGGRFVAEFGGKGNTRKILAALGSCPWYFPSIGEYTHVLERAGFEVRFATLFDRPTRAEGEDGLEDWLKMFGSTLFTPEARKAAVAHLRATMYHDGGWTIDYRRLRVVAVK